MNRIDESLIPEIDLVYLFGSRASGRVTPRSDVDIAVLLNRSVGRDRYFDIRIDLMGRFSKFYEKDDVEVVLLNEAPPLLKYEVVKGGEVLFKRSEDARIEFEVGVFREYLDTKPIRDLNYRYKLLRELVQDIALYIEKR